MQYNINHQPYIDADQAWRDAYNSWRGSNGHEQDNNAAHQHFRRACKFGCPRAHYWYSRFLWDCKKRSEADEHLQYAINKDYPPAVIRQIRIQIELSNVLSLTCEQLEALKSFGNMGYIYAEMLVIWYEIEADIIPPEHIDRLVELRQVFDRRVRTNGPSDWTLWN